MNKMNMKELADLVAVRNHVAIILDTQYRTIKGIDLNLRELDLVRQNLDKIFLENVLKLSLGQPTTKQLSFDFTKDSRKK